MPRLRRPSELPPLPEAFVPLCVGKNPILIDIRDRVPVHDQYGEPGFTWGKRKMEDILGICLHQTDSRNQDPLATAAYHASPGDHITIDGRGCPSVCYSIMVTEKGEAFLVADPAAITWSQAGDDSRYPGDENQHLLAVVAMGRFTQTRLPTERQQDAVLRVVYALQGALGLDDRGLFGHADFGKGNCPGPTLMGHVRRGRVTAYQAIRGQPGDLETAMQLQEALMALGYALPRYGADGHLGEETRAALSHFQRDRAMRQNGTADSFTRLRISREVEQLSPSSPAQ